MFLNISIMAAGVVVIVVVDTSVGFMYLADGTRWILSCCDQVIFLVHFDS